jgi:porphobilinogen synthase
MPVFPLKRLRRLRTTENMRRMVRETHVSVDDLIYPVFVTHDSTEPIASMPGLFRFNLRDLPAEAEKAVELGIPAIMLFGIPAQKDPMGTEAYAQDGIIPQALRILKKQFQDNLLLVPDICLCEYTSHGHCGILQGETVDNDSTLLLLEKTAVVYAKAGADILAPSDMMDGRIGAIRSSLDTNGFSDRPIMAYSAKYASAFYGPFRSAADSTPQFGDRKSYQMDPANRIEAQREIDEDVEEGADIIMVKPALPCLDIIREASNRIHLPIAAYNVSGEYSMVKAAAQNGWLDERKTVMEILTAIKRAGADIILTYHALDFARWRLSE